VPLIQPLMAKRLYRFVPHRSEVRVLGIRHQRELDFLPQPDKAGVITEFNVPSGAGLGRICTGYDGFDFVNMWFVESNADKVAKIAADGTITEFNLQGGGSPFDINYGFDGVVYVAEAGANLIARFNPVGVIIEFEPPTPNSQPFSIAQAGGPGSKIWFTERGAAKIGNMTFP